MISGSLLAKLGHFGVEVDGVHGTERHPDYESIRRPVVRIAARRQMMLTPDEAEQFVELVLRQVELARRRMVTTTKPSLR
ncbi:MAG: hypothetical protein ACYCZN_01330 [Candidatus Dormibacteria bacterium]